jgi:methylase of polypeptide subunit release factors
MKYKTARYKNINVSYLPVLDGGGDDFGQEFIRVVKEKTGKVDHIFEFCAGPGFIGFSLLAHGLCNKLTLADVNPEAVKACEDTIARNNLADRVKVYLSDCLDSIPTTEQWNLVVSNPPMANSSYEKYLTFIRKYDPGLMIHQKFYRDIHKFLKPRGSAMLQEDDRHTKKEDFLPMIEKSGLEVIDVFKARPLTWYECLTKVRFKAVVRRLLKGKNFEDRNPFSKINPSHVYYMWTRPKIKRI